MRVLLLLAMWLLAAVPAHAAESKLRLSKEGVKSEITNVIESQLAAFRTNDFAKAYTFAADGIKKQFAVEQFQEMVKRGYPVIAKSKSANFGICLDDGEQAVANVSVKGADDKVLHFQYMMIFENGKWRINGVVQKPPEGDEV